MPGRWIGIAGLACILASLLLQQTVGMIPGVILAAGAAYLGKVGLDSKGRGMALISLIASIVLLGVYLTVWIVGKENIDIAPR